MKLEVQAHEDNKTSMIVDFSRRENSICSKWMYKINYQVNDEVEKFKEKLVAKGYSLQSRRLILICHFLSCC